MNEIIIEKPNTISGGTITFHFRNPVYKQGDLNFEFKIPDIKENKGNDGFFFRSYFSEREKAIRFGSEVKIGGKKLDGVSLDPENFQMIKTYLEDLRDEWNRRTQQIIDEIVSGNRFINFHIVGSEYPHYHPFIDDLSEAGESIFIFRKALEKYSEGTISILNGDPDEILKMRLGFAIQVQDALPEQAKNISLDREKQKYYGFSDQVVTGFDLKLSDLISKEWVKARKEKQKAEEEYEKSLDMSVLKQGKNRDDIWAIVEVKSPITGNVMEFKCVNIFDVGFVVQKLSGEENAEFEEQCRKYIVKFSPISTEIRL